MSDQQKDPDHERWAFEQDRALAERQHDLESDFGNRANQFAVMSGNHAVRALVLINGGAAIALLAFIGQVVSADKLKIALKLSEMTPPLSWFAGGVSAAVCSIAFAYFTNYSVATASGLKSRQYEHPYVTATPESERWTKALKYF